MLSIALAGPRRLRPAPVRARLFGAPAGSPTRWRCCGWCWLIVCEGGLRSTASWASAVGLADISNVALLNRLRGCGDWLAALVGCLLAAAAPAVSGGRLIRLIDATVVPKAGAARGGNGVWRVHSAFDVPAERFSFFALSEERGGEQLDRVAVEPGEIRIADRAHMQPERIAAVRAAMLWCAAAGVTRLGVTRRARRSTSLWPCVRMPSAA